MSPRIEFRLQPTEHRLNIWGMDRIVSREMVAFEWLREAGTPLFREICRDFLKQGAPAGDGASTVLRGLRDRAG